jgi:UPF0755 protein
VSERRAKRSTSDVEPRSRRAASPRVAPSLRWAYAALALVATACVLSATVWLLAPHRGHRGAIRVTLPERATADDVAAALYRAGALDRPWLFSWAMVMTGVSERIPRRTLLLRDDLSPRALLRAIAAGGALIRVTIPEGYTRFEVAQRLAREGVLSDEAAFVRATEDPAVLARVGVEQRSLEGYLFPDTYDLYPESSAEEVVERMVRNFKRRFDELKRRVSSSDPRVAQLSLSDAQLVTLASMIEEEAGTPEDRALIASVFYNRMTRADFVPRLLQSDPTIVYGCRLGGAQSCEGASRTGRIAITRAMLDDASNAYNTYRHEGLPPGPISNPGRASLEAAMRPADTRALYFVAIGGGRSAFADTLAEHNANVQRYLRRR